MRWLENLVLWSLLGWHMQQMTPKSFTLYMYSLKNFLWKVCFPIYSFGSSYARFLLTDTGFWNISAAGVSLSGISVIVKSPTGSFLTLKWGQYPHRGLEIHKSKNKTILSSMDPPFLPFTVPELGPAAWQSWLLKPMVIFWLVLNEFMDLNHFYVLGDPLFLCIL